MMRKPVADFVGMKTHYNEFRFGNPRPVYDPARPKGRVKLSGQAREHVLGRVTEIMAGWTYSPFEYEGSCRHGIRSGLCMEGATWPRADLEAAAIVDEALRRLRARRPTWEEGQWTHTHSREQCQWCGRPMEEIERTRGQRHCSVSCAAAAKQHLADKSSEYAGAAIRAAKRLIDKSRAAVRECAHCGSPFQSDRPNAKYCSLRCARHSNKPVLANKDCERCGRVFHPANAKVRFCSRRCSLHHRYDSSDPIVWPVTPHDFDLTLTFPANETVAHWLSAGRFDQMVAA